MAWGHLRIPPVTRMMMGNHVSDTTEQECSWRVRRDVDDQQRLWFIVQVTVQVMWIEPRRKADSVPLISSRWLVIFFRTVRIGNIKQCGHLRKSSPLASVRKQPFGLCRVHPCHATGDESAVYACCSSPVNAKASRHTQMIRKVRGHNKHKVNVGSSSRNWHLSGSSPEK